MESRATCRQFGPIKFASILLLPLATAISQSQTFSKPVISAHGTVNILFADQNGLVAVTDSMLSNTTLNIHRKVGEKLFKIDTRTICMMAGQYSEGGPAQESSLALFVPTVMREFSAELTSGRTPPLSFAQKAEKLSRFFAFRMTANLLALASDSKDLSHIEPLYLTLAGYDLDGSLRVAELGFKPDEGPTGAFSSHIVREKQRFETLLPCEVSIGLDPQSASQAENAVRIRTMGKTFFCEAVGLAYIVEQMMSSPDKYSRYPAVARYGSFLKGGPALTTEEMKALALELENETEIDQTRGGALLVGGIAEYAVLKNGEISEFSDNPVAELAPPGTGEALNSSQFTNTEEECRFPGQTPMVNQVPTQMIPAQLNVKRCSQSLDGFNFHNSRFIDSDLYYFKTGLFEFGDENVVTGSTLLLGPNVDLSNPRVIHLICMFARDKVTTQGKSPLPKCGTAK